MYVNNLGRDIENSVLWCKKTQQGPMLIGAALKLDDYRDQAKEPLQKLKNYVWLHLLYFGSLGAISHNEHVSETMYFVDLLRFCVFIYATVLAINAETVPCSTSVEKEDLESTERSESMDDFGAGADALENDDHVYDIDIEARQNEVPTTKLWLAPLIYNSPTYSSSFTYYG